MVEVFQSLADRRPRLSAVGALVQSALAVDAARPDHLRIRGVIAKDLHVAAWNAEIFPRRSAIGAAIVNVDVGEENLARLRSEGKPSRHRGVADFQPLPRIATIF